MALSSFQRLTYLFARTFASDFYRRCVVNIFARLFLTSVWYHRQCFFVAFFIFIIIIIVIHLLIENYLVTYFEYFKYIVIPGGKRREQRSPRRSL